MFDKEIASAHFEQDVKNYYYEKLIIKLGDKYSWSDFIFIETASCRVFRNKDGKLEYSFAFGSHEKDGYHVCANNSEEVSQLIAGNIPDFMHKNVVGYPANINDINRMLLKSDKIYDGFYSAKHEEIIEQFFLNAYRDSDEDIYLVIQSKDHTYFKLVRLFHDRDRFLDFNASKKDFTQDERNEKFIEFFKKEFTD